MSYAISAQCLTGRLHGQRLRRSGPYRLCSTRAALPYLPEQGAMESTDRVQMVKVGRAQVQGFSPARKFRLLQQPAQRCLRAPIRASGLPPTNGKIGIQSIPVFLNLPVPARSWRLKRAVPPSMQKSKSPVEAPPTNFSAHPIPDKAGRKSKSIFRSPPGDYWWGQTDPFSL